MSFSRRRFIVGSAILSAWTLVGRVRGATLPNDPLGLEQMLEAWVETLLPSDEMGQGAGRLGVHLQIIEKAASKKQYLQLLELGVRWTDQEASKLGASRFTELSSDQAEAVVAGAESLGLQSMPGLFFYHTLRDAKSFYYGRKASWAGVGFPHAPQPLGFMDYAEAPK
jgi:hypothetical protein